MGRILCIETSTTNCSVGLSVNGEVVNVRELNDGYTHAENITVFIEAVLTQSGLKIKDLDAVAVSKGPGSYTGLRIGVSAAKGLCYATGKPLISIDTLFSMAVGISSEKDEDAFYCPMIDARRMEVYCAVYDSNMNKVQPINAIIVEGNSFAAMLDQKPVYFFGDGAMKCKAVIEHPNAKFIESVFPSASYIGTIAEQKLNSKDFEDLASFEPYYLKDFIAGKGSVNPLRS
jgi:tRNA threonylcarbamoyladenosine biosynthesis protein TsaB